MVINNLTLIEKLNYSLKKVGKIGLFKCSCGNYKKLPIRYVVNEKVKSCGCLKYRKDGVKTTKEDKIPYRRWIKKKI